MAAPTLVLSETNTSAATVTDNVPQISFASVDAASTAGLSAANPISSGSNSFEKWNRVAVTAVAPNSISQMSAYFSGNPIDGGGSATNLPIKYAVNAAFATPVAAASTVATSAVSGNTSAPGATLTAPANTVGARSGYVTMQMQTAAGASGGNAVFGAPFLSISYTWS